MIMGSLKEDVNKRSTDKPSVEKEKVAIPGEIRIAGEVN
jgi:hypothetical protein